jgi:maleate isomerase
MSRFATSSPIGLRLVDVVRLKDCAARVRSRSRTLLRDAILEVNGPDVDAIIRVGTNLIMARLAGIAEFWLDNPVMVINTATYWHAMRKNGIDDKFDGFGSLLRH